MERDCCKVICGNRKRFLEILSPCASASHFMCMFVLSLYIYIYGMLRPKGRERDSLQLENGNVGRVLAPFISKI